MHEYQAGAPMERVPMDFLGPLPKTPRGNEHILMMVDQFTKWSWPGRGPPKDARSAKVNRPVEICPVAECCSEVSRMHAATHLPGIFDDQLEPTEELMRRISVLKICKSRLLGSNDWWIM